MKPAQGFTCRNGATATAKRKHMWTWSRDSGEGPIELGAWQPNLCSGEVYVRLRFLGYCLFEHAERQAFLQRGTPATQQRRHDDGSDAVDDRVAGRRSARTGSQDEQFHRLRGIGHASVRLSDRASGPARSVQHACNSTEPHCSCLVLMDACHRVVPQISHIRAGGNVGRSVKTARAADADHL